MENFVTIVMSLVACLIVVASAQETEQLIIDGYEECNKTEDEIFFQDGEAKDRDYFCKIDFKEKDIPRKIPNEKEVLNEYWKQVKKGTIEVLIEEQVKGDRLVLPSLKEAIANVEVATVNFTFSLASLVKFNPWCPRSQSYACSSDTVLLPCFQIQLFGRWGVCCPLWPLGTFQRCNCGRCSRLCSDCIQSGNCVQSYTFKWFFASCNHLVFWKTIVLFNRYVPTSCYCNAPQCV